MPLKHRGLHLGRHRSRLKQILSHKRALFTLFRAATMGSPFLRRLISFYPELRIGAPDSYEVIHRSSFPHPWQSSEFADARRTVQSKNVDVKTLSAWSDAYSTERYVAIHKSVIVPGHRLTPVDPVSATQIGTDVFGLATWNNARPSFSGLNSIILNENLTIVIPPSGHYGHLLTDIIFPIYFALQKIGFTRGKKLNFVTTKEPNSLIQAFIKSLSDIGYDVLHISPKCTETLFVPNLLFAAMHCQNVENKFATEEVIDLAKKHLLNALPLPVQQISNLIFLRRGDTRTRVVKGEAELAEKLSSIGFVNFEARWDNISDQIMAFQNAKVVVAVHGAGMANILWAKRGTLLIELMAHNARKTTGLHWASCVGARYHPILGSDEREKQNFSINPEASFLKIKNFLHR